MRTFASILLVLGITCAWPGFAVLAKPGVSHWAAESVALMESIGAAVPGDSLNDPIPADEWERMATVVFAPVLAARHKDYHYWINAYTHLQLAEGKIERRWAVGGLVKLLNGAGVIPGSFAGKDAKLERFFSDAEKIGDDNDVLWELAYQFSLVKGYPGETLAPDQYLTYAEAAVLLDRAFMLVSEHRFGYVEAIGEQPGKLTLSFDEAKWLTDEQAIRAAMMADGRCAGEEESCSAPNGFYIQNESVTYEPIALSPAAVILALRSESREGSEWLTVSDWQAELAEKRTADGMNPPYHLYLYNGTVVKIVEQYLP